MILCFQCSNITKQQIDKLIQSGRYPNLSELMSVAISNQVMLHEHLDKDGSVVLGDAQEPTSSTERLGAGGSIEMSIPEVQALDLTKHRDNGISALFTNRPTSPSGPTAELPGDEQNRSGDHIAPSLWIFGQYNRLLPAKASCRALANLLVDGRGLDAAGVAKKIAGEAAELGNSLRILDRRHQRPRDEMLCTAFPGLVDPDKGRLRYANQFVASVDKQGRLLGLLFDLKLINRVSNREPRIALTEPGWRFALMTNPVLDHLGDQGVQERFSKEERDFLLAHILTSVPRERCAYRVIISAIEDGKDTPDAISEVMKQLEHGGDDIDSLLATQRSGAISRMSDLGLLSREREGIRVRYSLTEDGRSFLQPR